MPTHSDTDRPRPTSTTAHQHIPTHATQSWPMQLYFGCILLTLAQIFFYKANCAILYLYNQPNEQNPQLLGPMLAMSLTA